MSGVWVEKSVLMTDEECAVEAIEAIGGRVLSSTSSSLSISIGGQHFTLNKQHGRYTLRYNRRNSSSIRWMEQLNAPYEEAVQRKLRRLRTLEEAAALASERQSLQREREAFENARQAAIQERREHIIERAKAMGYRVKERQEQGQIRLVLVRQG